MIDTVVKNFKGEDIKNVEVDKEGKPVEKGMYTYRILIGSIVPSQQQGEVLTGEQKTKMGMLAQKIWGAGKEVELSAEEIVLAKERVGILGSPLDVIRVAEFLEPKGKEAPETTE